MASYSQHLRTNALSFHEAYPNANKLLQNVQNGKLEATEAYWTYLFVPKEGVPQFGEKKYPFRWLQLNMEGVLIFLEEYVQPKSFIKRFNLNGVSTFLGFYYM